MTKGYAQKILKCDVVKYTFCLKAGGDDSSASVNSVNNELEKFLGIMERNGIAPVNMVTESHSVEESYAYRSDTEPKYSARHTISLRMNYDPKFTAKLYEIIAEEHLNVLVNEEYICTSSEKEHNELLQLAIKYARNKAERIAELSGCRIVGIKTINIDPTDHMDKLMECERAIAAPMCSSPSNMSRLSGPEICESETAEIVWLIEGT